SADDEDVEAGLCVRWLVMHAGGALLGPGQGRGRRRGLPPAPSRARPGPRPRSLVTTQNAWARIQVTERSGTGTRLPRTAPPPRAGARAGARARECRQVREAPKPRTPPPAVYPQFPHPGGVAIRGGRPGGRERGKG